MNEDVRQSYQWALSEAEKFYCKESSFLHDKNLVPFYENILFALLLMKSRNKEKIEQAAWILQRILAHEKSGLFPLYLHEYPSSSPRSFSFFAALYLIYRDFRHVLEKELRKDLEQTLFRMLETKPFHFQSELLFACGKYALGLQDDKELNSLAEKKDCIAWQRPAFLFEIFSALEILEQRPAAWSFFYEALASLWHAPTKSLLSTSLLQESPLHFLFNQRLISFPHFLQLAHVKGFFSQTLNEPKHLQKLSNFAAFSLQTIQGACFVCADKSLFAKQEKDQALFRFLLQEKEPATQFSCIQAKVYPDVHFLDNGLDLIFSFDKTNSPDNKEKGQELDFISNKELFVGKEKATYVLEGQTICPKDSSLRISFHAIEGRFAGRLSCLEGGAWKLKIKTWEEKAALCCKLRVIS